MAVGWVAGTAVRTPTLGADGVQLRPWDPDEAAWYVRARDSEVLFWTGETADLTEAEARASILANRNHPTNVCLAILEASRNQLAGNIALRIRDSQAEIMYFLAPEARGHGLATRAVRLLTAWAFTEVGLTRVWLRMKPRNWRSRGVAVRAGFTRCPRRPGSRLRYYHILSAPG